MRRDTAERLFLRYRDRGDIDAIGRLLDRLYPTLLNGSRKLCSSEVVAEDVVQETILTLIESGDRWDPSRPLVPWLMGILANHARAARRSASPAAREDHPAPAAEISSRAEHSELARLVEGAVDALPARYREVTVMRLVEDLEPAEIARVLGRSTSTVRTQLQRGLDRLRRKLPAGCHLGIIVPLLPPYRAARARALRRAGERVAARDVATSASAGGLGLKLKVAAAGFAAVVAVGAWSLAGSNPESALDVIPQDARGVAAGPGERGESESAEGAGSAGRVGAVAGSTPSRPGERTLEAAQATGDAKLVVRAVDPETRGGVDGVVLRIRVTTSSGPITVRGVTDADGRYVADLPAPAGFRIWAPRRTARNQFDSVDGRLVAGSVVEREIEVPQYGPIAGLVVDVEGHPVPRAEIWLGLTDGDNAVARRADGDGRFRFEGASSRVGVTACAPTHAVSRTRIVRSAGREEIVLKLRGRPTRLVGTVRDQGGIPLSGVELDVSARLPEAFEVTPAFKDDDFAPPRFPVLTSDATGFYAVDGLARGTWYLEARARGFAPRLLRIDVVGDSDLVRVDVTLTEGATLVGDVLTPDGEPVVGVHVTVGEGALLTPVFAVTDARGAFRVAHAPTGDVLMKVRDHHSNVISVDDETLRDGESVEWRPECVPRPPDPNLEFDMASPVLPLRPVARDG